MPHEFSANLQAGFLGQSYSQDFGVDCDMAVPFSPNVDPAEAGTLTTRTDDDTGTVTITDAGHGILTGDVVDVYWADGMRANMTVGTVAGTSVPIDGGTGDVLPVAATAINVAKQHTEDCVVTGNNVVAIGVNAGAYRVTANFVGAAAAILHTVQLEVNSSYVWTSALGTTNPLAGDAVLKVHLSQESPTETVTVNGAVGYN